MTLEIHTKDLYESIVYDVQDFEFRANQVENWIRVKFDGGEEKYYYGVIKIKTIKDDRM